MRLSMCLLVAAFVCCLSLNAGEGKYKVQSATTPPPAELSAQVQKLFASKSIQFADETGTVIAEFWFRPEIPVDATPEQIKNGLTYKEVRQTEILGAVRFDRDWSDYRKQRVKAGVYTLRLGYQPMDGDHQGSSEFQDFLVVVAAAKDASPDLLEAKELIERSGKSIATGHPGVFMLFPYPKPAAAPELTVRPRNHLFLGIQGDTSAQGKKTSVALGIGMTLVGHAE